MTFFNKKEEVFHIELTPYGRHCLSVGKLKPHHYKFFDDDIIYDITAATTGSGKRTEEQNSIHTRIIQETPKLKPNPNISGVETYSSVMQLLDPNGPEFQYRADIGVNLPNLMVLNRDDNVNFLQREVGTNSYESQYTPALRFDLFEGEMTGSATKFLTSHNSQNINIPQMNVEIVYRYVVKSESDPTDPGGVATPGEYQSLPFDDGTVISVMPQAPIVRILEENSFDEKENWSMQAWIVESSSLGSIYNPLKFPKQFSPIVGDLLLDTAESNLFNTQQETQDIDTGHVNYYLNFNLDRMIPNEDLCRTIGELPIRNIFLDEPLPCPDQEIQANFDIYATRVSADDLEDCD